MYVCADLRGFVPASGAHRAAELRPEHPGTKEKDGRSLGKLGKLRVLDGLGFRV